MKHICSLIIALGFIIKPSFSQNTTISIPLGNNYIFTQKNMSFDGKTIAIGKDAGKMLPLTSVAEIYIGNGAGEFISNSSQCIGIGSRSMSNSSGIRNIAIGTDAMRFNTKWDNIAVGSESLVNNQIGVHNIGIGSYTIKMTKHQASILL